MIQNSANFDEIIFTTTIVGTNGGPSYYGTYDQCGNVYEWTEGVGPNIVRNDKTYKTRSVRGGRYVGRNAELGLRSDYGHHLPPEQRGPGTGFRICSHSYGHYEIQGVLQKHPLADPLRFSTFAIVGDPDNQPDIPVPIVRDGKAELDPVRHGAVKYEYLIQQFPVTVEEYCEFLNAVASIEDKYSLYDIGMSNANEHGILTRNRIADKFVYKPIDGKHRRPVTWISWYCAARFVNWLSNGKPTGKQNDKTTEDGAYTIGPKPSTDIYRNILNPNTHQPPTYWLPNEDEWYKAAYYKGGDKDAGYWTFATQSDEIPHKITGDNLGNGNAHAPLPRHEHFISDIKDFSGKKGISIIDLGKTVLEFQDGILVNYRTK